MHPFKVFAIDPGPRQSTFAAVEFTGKKKLLDNAIEIMSVGALDNEEMVNQVRAMYGFHMVCEEMKFYGMQAGAECFDTARWSGHFERVCKDRGTELVLMPRQVIKSYVCFTVKAGDKQVRDALIMRYGEPGTKKSPGPLFGISGHSWAALACAVAFHDRALEAYNESARLNKTNTVTNPIQRPRPSCEAATGGTIL